MEAELAGLAASGATTVVGLMASDAWAQVRARLARFLARGGAEGAEEAASADLERSRGELVEARQARDAGTEDDVLAEWRLRLRRTLQADPAAAEELRRMLAELAPESRAAGGTTYYTANTTHGGVYHEAVIQAGSITYHGVQPPGHDTHSGAAAAADADPPAGC
ncbi:hypothetical protein [Streptomyces sp. NRRL F-5123]|uniref:hypothetical protein n=1 Tax=Streptomyces sp. NRRL F-5123 TaxID=1463856 RepID=UPI0007C5C863|nr:hypothetical protein [Streptomyces sp. NRRL F-5123]